MNDHKIITSQKYNTPPYEWSKNIYQKWKPISGNFPIDDTECGNNYTGRAYYANPCGYWNNVNPQFNTGQIKSNISMPGALFPSSNTSNPMVPPNDRLVRPYVRIGEEYRNA